MTDPVIPAAEAASIAKVYGQPMLEMPQDLYIPPDALEVFLEQFEGPLDLLLYLIRKENISVLEIPMAKLTLQYLEYVELMRAQQLELAAEYLLMAAMLIEIKSRMLLPRPKNTEIEEDPRAELVRRLMEYEQMKLAGQKLNELPQAEREFFWVETLVEKSLYVRHPDVSVDDLKDAWMAIFRQASLKKHHRIGREELSVREHMGIILRLLQERGGFVQFETMFDPEMGAPGLVVHFLAMLELAREKLVEFTQTEAFQPIYVRVHQGGTEPGQESA
jgi:segregation and condensation protein A